MLDYNLLETVALIINFFWNFLPSFPSCKITIEQKHSPARATVSKNKKT